ncbi:antitoxin Xre/MbcA/ParS toxin-binding domain-containing protein [Granulicella sp. 5B5]|uniref:type II RES/Xre toxin-antitoxin system antitoxin n=1 Tax=Granulicella sp. 5B5 TaxID=1617967 RepID=UPI0015F712AF|nr:antitoxin Xre/MbcA/ParS toxin-binding domain-containing protein [Granulicella sp. 5B5]
MTVAAITAVLGGRKILKRRVESDRELTQLTREGVPVGALTLLASELALDRRTLARVIGISDRTLSRRLAKDERLSAEESDRVVRVARVVAMATDTLGSPAKASSWLQSPNMVLDGQAPLDLLDTDSGTRSVETVLGRIEWGIYS